MVNDYPLFVSYFTADDIYTAAANRLVASLDKFNLPHVISKVERKGNWLEMQSLKPKIIKDAHKNFDKDIVWIDADNEVLQEPILLKKVDDFDITVVRFDRYDYELNTSVIGFKHRIIPFLMKAWEKLLKTDLWDQHSFHQLIQKYCLQGAVVGMLPETYAGNDPETAVIYQHHASIEARRVYG